MTWPRKVVEIRAQWAWCSVCHETFASSEGFDIHRAIRVRPSDELAQDGGRCRTTSLRLHAVICKVPGIGEDVVWFTEADMSRHVSMIKLREARDARKTA